MTLAVEYDNRARVPEHPAIIARWKADAEAFRARAAVELDLSYGAGPRHRVDLFHPPGGRKVPLVVFIHGGYWRAFDKSLFSHMAAGAVAHGLPVAVPNYSLCPDAEIAGIIDEMRQCCLFLWRKLGWPLVVAGHSAGGHLAACLAATRWDDHGAPAGLIRSGMSVSGIFDLRPLIATPLNADLRLDGASALQVSPLTWPVPRTLPFDLWVGAEESAEFLRQSRSLSAAWTGLGMPAPCVEVPGANHFSVADGFADAASAMSRRLAGLAQA
jgi:arylformamidase